MKDMNREYFEIRQKKYAKDSKTECIGKIRIEENLKPFDYYIDWIFAFSQL